MFFRVSPFLLVPLFFLPQGAEGRVLVQLSGDVKSPATLSVQSDRPGWRYLSEVDLYIVDEKGEGLLKTLAEGGGIDAMEAQSDIQIENLPDDPLIGEQGWVPVEGERMGVDIGISEAWGLVTGSPRVTVAVIDTGIDLDHPDLRDNLWTNEGEVPANGIDDDQNGFIDDVYGFNFREETSDVRDENGHGSHLAGVIGGVGNNGVGVAGINWDIRLMALKFTDAQGAGSSAGAVEAIDYAIRNGADIINASWTLKMDEGVGENSLLKRAIQKAGEAGILFVTAAGNQFTTGVGLNIDGSPVYPARFSLENLIAVAALDEEGGLASYSNYGPASVLLAAPGSGILSTFLGGNYAAMSGTSVATAFVSGAAALLTSLRPELSPSEIRSVLEGSVAPSVQLENRVSSGGALRLNNSLSVLTGVPLSSPIEESGPSPAAIPPPPLPAPISGRGSGCSLIPGSG